VEKGGEETDRADSQKGEEKNKGNTEKKTEGSRRGTAAEKRIREKLKHKLPKTRKRNETLAKRAQKEA